MSTQHDWTSIPVKPETFEAVKRMKRGGETFDELVNKMCERYNPDNPEANQ